MASSASSSRSLQSLLVPLATGLTAGFATVESVAGSGAFVAWAWALLLVTTIDIGWRLASALLPEERSTAVFLLAGALVFESVASASVVLTGFFEVLTLALVLIVIGGTHLVVVRTTEGSDRPRRSLTSVFANLPFGRGTHSGVAACATWFALVVALVAFNQSRFTMRDADAMWYQLALPAEWVRTASIWPVESIPSMGIGYPGFRHALLAWLSLPSGDEHLAMIGAFETTLLALSVYAVGRLFGASRTIATPVGLYAATTPVMLKVATLQGNDTALGVHMLLALLFLGRFVRDRRTADAVLGGLALGALAGIKYSGPAYCGLALFATAFAFLRSQTNGPGLWPRAVWLALGPLVLAAPWYLRNLIAFGNPFWPAELRLPGVVLAEGLIGKEYFAREKVGWNIAVLFDEAHRHHWIEAHGWLVFVFAIAFVPFAIAAVRSTGTSRRAALLGFALSPLLFVIFLHHPFNSPKFNADYTQRYLSVWWASTAAMTAVSITRFGAPFLPWAWLMLAGSVWAVREVTGLWPVMLVVTLGAVAAAAWPKTRELLERCTAPLLALRVPLLVFVALFALAGYGLRSLQLRAQYDSELGYRDSSAERGWASSMVWVHQNVAERRIGLHGSFFFFPLLGEPWSNEVLLADDLILGEPDEYRTVDQVVAWVDREHLDYLVACRFRTARLGSREYTFAEGFGRELLERFPDRFVVRHEDQGSYVLEVVRR